MNPTEFIVGLMRHNTDALGFIPKTEIERRFVHQDLYLIQRNRFGHPIGYLIHGPVHHDGTLYIHQACIELDRRNRGFGKDVVNRLVHRALKGGAVRILLRCASDLDAVQFWQSCDFVPIAITPGGVRRHRTIVQYERILRQPQDHLDSGPLPEPLRPNA